MDMERINTDRAPIPAGPYSQATVFDNTVFISGQIPLDPATGSIPNNPNEQIKLAFKNMLSLLDECGVSKDNIAKVNVYLTDSDLVTKMNEIYSMMFGPPYPARTCVIVKSLPKNVVIMVDSVGYRE